VAAGLAAGLMLFGLLLFLAAIALGVVEMTRK
jgi:hypothetical protein